MTGKEVSLYIHVPFCSKKCPYCHFFVLPHSEESQKLFLQSLHQEWELKKDLLQDKEIVSIYLGGGTPSLLPTKSIEEILSWIQKGPSSMRTSCEITLEANPETTQKQFMQECKEAGINRVSIGVQSFDDDLLKMLGRTHDSKQAKKAIREVFEANIFNISIDLMYELPFQSAAQWDHSLKQVQDLPITHLSLYNLVFEPGTLFYKKQKQWNKHLPSQEESLYMLNQATLQLPAIGLKRYEISAFAKEGFSSMHNTGYWTARPFLGLGPSAFSYFNNRRFRNTAHLKKWTEQIEQKKFPEDFTEMLSYEHRQKELLAVELRLLEGVDLTHFEEKNGAIEKELLQAIKRNIEQGFLLKEKSRLRLSKKGLLFYDTVAENLM
jgi:oxygen-independent coproporphyrinogen III oxidase